MRTNPGWGWGGRGDNKVNLKYNSLSTPDLGREGGVQGYADGVTVARFRDYIENC